MIYLDYNATTPVAPSVAAAHDRALRELWGNASSDHAYGRAAARALGVAREQVASLLAADPAEIVFTSGGTESNNAALVGVAEALQGRGRHIVTSTFEHPAVEATCRYLEERGFEVERVPPDRDGVVPAGAVAAALRPDTILVSVMHAQNELGTLQPLREIADAAHARGVFVHSDAAQSVGKVATRVDELGVDLLTIAGHKLYAPKGVGALYVRRETPLRRFMHGAGHEAGRRAGTEATPLAVALGAACALPGDDLSPLTATLASLRDRLEAGLRAEFPEMIVHGADAPRLPTTLSAAFPGSSAAAVVAGVEGVCCAAGSACDAGSVQPSATLRAIGLPDELGLATLRLTVGSPTTEAEIDAALPRLAAAIRANRV